VAKWNPKGDTCREGSDYSTFPGNTNTLVFKLAEYVENLKRTGGVIPEFVNPKYANEERTVFKSPTRLECMMQDYPKLLDAGTGRVGYTMFETWFCFSPVKNNINDALACVKKGLPSFGAASGEYDFYQWTNKMLRLVGAEVEERDEKKDWMQIQFPVVPKILLEPGFALTL
jgi:UDP-sugar pyrophosphorylase